MDLQYAVSLAAMALVESVSSSWAERWSAAWTMFSPCLAGWLDGSIPKNEKSNEVDR